MTDDPDALGTLPFSHVDIDVLTVLRVVVPSAVLRITGSVS